MANDKRKNIKGEKERSKPKQLTARATEFFAGIRNELKRVVWPTRETLKETTLAVLAISIGVAILVFAVDSVMMGLLNLAGFNRPHSAAHVSPVTVTETSEAATSNESSESTAAESASESGTSEEATAATSETK